MNKHIHLIHAALDLRKGKEYPQAAALLQQAIQLAPEYIPGYIYLGLVYQDQEKFAEAENIFRQALLHEPENPQALQCLGMLYLQQERYPEAIVNLEKHLQIEPDNNASLDVLIPLLASSGRSEDAEAILQAAWQKTEEPRLAVKLARFLISHEKLDQAIQFLHHALQVNENANLLVELALVLVIQEQYPAAVEALLRAVALRPDYDRAYRGLAHCYTQMDQGDKAIEYAERALAIDPRHYRNWQAKSDVLLLLKRYEEAAQAAALGIRLIQELAPEEREEAEPVLNVLYLQRFNAQRRNKDLGAAIAGLSEARAEFPRDARFYIFSVPLFVQANLTAQAVELLPLAARAGLPDGDLDQLRDILFNSAVELYLDGQVSKALKIFEPLIAWQPDNTQISSATAYVLTGEGALERAETLLHQAIQATSTEDVLYGMCLCDLGYIQLLRGQEQLAQDTFQTVLQVDNYDEAFLRIGFWHNGQIIPDYKAHPTRSVSTHWGAKANLIALALSQQDIEQAQQMAEQLHEHTQQSCTSNMILGTVAWAKKEYPVARRFWETASECAEDQGEVDLIQTWLGELPK